MSSPPSTFVTPLRFEPLTGPEIEPITVEGTGQSLLGRASACDIGLPDNSVSRRHARVECRGGTWIIADLGSRHGTFVNGVMLSEGQAAPLRNGDLLRVGPWTFRVRTTPGSTSGTPTTDDAAMSTQHIEKVDEHELASLAQQRLTLLIDCAAAINSSKTEKELAESVLAALMQGTKYPRAAMLRYADNPNEVEVISRNPPPGETGGSFGFSRSLLAQATSGEIVRLSPGRNVPVEQSIVQLGIQSAICAPVMLGETVAAYLYLDSRGTDGPVYSDAAAFCQAIARICGLALANLKRVELEDRQQELERDIDAARRAQSLMVPRASGRIGRISYHMRMQPGRFVAGDLFDVIDLDDGRVCVLLGDVRGQGVGAGILMAAAQAHLHAGLTRYGDPAEAVEATNRHLAPRTDDGSFMTLWVGVFDADRGTLRFVDAGHGYCLRRLRDQSPEMLTEERHLVVGVDTVYGYTSQEIALHEGDRFVLFSDGIVEQAAPSGERFNVERVLEAIQPASCAEEDLRLLAKAVTTFAGADQLADDNTIACVEILTSVDS